MFSVRRVMMMSLGLFFMRPFKHGQWDIGCPSPLNHPIVNKFLNQRRKEKGVTGTSRNEGLDGPLKEMQPATPDWVRVWLRAFIPLKMSSFRFARTTLNLNQLRTSFPESSIRKNTARE